MLLPSQVLSRCPVWKTVWTGLVLPSLTILNLFKGLLESTIRDEIVPDSVLAFRMRNTPAMFRRLMHKVLSNIPSCATSLGDIVICSNDCQDHLKTEDVFQRLAKASLTLNLTKCEFAKVVVTYLEKKVVQGYVRPIEAKIAAMVELPTVNKRQLRWFLGMTGYYGGFCRNFACIVSPLTDLLSVSKRFVWTPECEQRAFVAAKDILCNATIHFAPNFDLPFKLQVDACATGPGWCWYRRMLKWWIILFPTTLRHFQRTNWSQPPYIFVQNVQH